MSQWLLRYSEGPRFQSWASSLSHTRNKDFIINKDRKSPQATSAKVHRYQDQRAPAGRAAPAAPEGSQGEDGDASHPHPQL